MDPALDHEQHVILISKSAFLQAYLFPFKSLKSLQMTINCLDRNISCGWILIGSGFAQLFPYRLFYQQIWIMSIY